ncbi:CDP-diacylglycerol/serine O-phosphatidyltransferase [Kyrpidia tusciae DSM 2912]|uniref:CDP-diacylglycerol--serine O-phosphatidyltransferase n=1 Tax=Kyrpidia tusciae (strain DSM 2912 / NBRC 15312 / T2) TaxID=562970 RepID=D5WQR1_KYRT2|nr:CDP-diacylglycerol/serine O-phosphatidyltransferase [Kyrpidia tusciae DSM 2912]
MGARRDRAGWNPPLRREYAWGGMRVQRNPVRTVLRIRRVSPNPTRRWLKYAANTITAVNLSLGLLSVLLSSMHLFHWAAVALMVAVLFDRLDGSTARRLGIASDFGRELDSLSDLVSFGVAPALLVYTQVYMEHLPLVGGALSIVYVLCGALRLARYNVQRFSGGFLGVPITFAGGVLGLLSFVSRDVHVLGFAAAEILLSALMVSKIPIKKF